MSGLNSATSPSFQNRSDLDSQNLPEMKKKFRKPSLSFNQRKTSRPDSGNREQKSTPSLLFPAWSLSEAIGKDPEQFEKCRPNCWEYKKDLIAPLKAYDEIERQMANDSILGFRPTPGVLRFWNEMKRLCSRRGVKSVRPLGIMGVWQSHPPSLKSSANCSPTRTPTRKPPFWNG